MREIFEGKEPPKAAVEKTEESPEKKNVKEINLRNFLNEETSEINKIIEAAKKGALSERDPYITKSARADILWALGNLRVREQKNIKDDIKKFSEDYDDKSRDRRYRSNNTLLERLKSIDDSYKEIPLIKNLIKRIEREQNT